MSAGELDQRISLQRLTLTPDGVGGSTEAWEEYAAVWARVRPQRGRERQESERQEATREYRVKIRHRSDVLEADRIVWRERQLNIRVLHDKGPRELYLEIDAELGEAS